MYKSLAIENFRSFPELNIPDLNRINLIAGKNNVGKTTFLEAVFLLTGAYNPTLTLKIDGFRGISGVDVELVHLDTTPWDGIFHNFDTTKTIKIIGRNGRKFHRALKFKIIRDPKELAEINQYLLYPQKSVKTKELVNLTTEAAHVFELECKEKGTSRKYYMILDKSGMKVIPIPPPPPQQAIFVPARMIFPLSMEAKRFGKLEILGKVELVVDALKVVEPKLERITVIPSGRETMLYGEIGKNRLMPLPLMGEGMVRLLSYLLAIADAKDGVVLIDEIENGLHYSVMSEVWRAIAKAAREFNVQIFATTHSHECIEKAHEAFSKNHPEEFNLHRLEADEETIRAVTIDHKTLGIALKKGLEIR